MDSAPRFVANAGVTLSSWQGWGEAPVCRIHATPGYSRTVTLGLAVRFRGK